LTSPENHETKALAVKETWGKRCNVLLFMSSGNGNISFSNSFLFENNFLKFLLIDSNLPSVQLAVREGRNGLWGKTREAFRYAWDRYQDEVDWFLKADDDT
jgi:glycoprotein-N-acetylgalactosamine 3-beta-galactosyltransferase